MFLLFLLVHQPAAFSVEPKPLEIRNGTIIPKLLWKDNTFKDNLLVIPGTTPGLKRTKKTEDLPHHVPLTKEMNALLKQAKQMNGHLPYVFGPVREHSRYPHLDPESPNNLLVYDLASTNGVRPIDDPEGPSRRVVRLTPDAPCLLGHFELSWSPFAPAIVH